MNEDELYDKLERFVRGKLPPDEAAALERDMAKDPDLREQVRLHRLELESHEYLLREKLRQNVRQWIAEAPPPDPPSSFWKTWGLPLALITFVVLGLWVLVPILKKNTTPGSQPVEQKSQEGEKAPPASMPDRPVAQDDSPKTAPDGTPHAQPDRGYLALAETNYRLPTHLDGGDLKSDSPTDTATTPLAAGIRAFLNGRYQTAIRELGRVREAPDPDAYLQAQEWLAHAWFKRGTETRDFDRAVEHFDRLTRRQDNSPAEQDRAEWYLLLSLLPDYPQHKARVDTLLKKILAMQDHSFYGDARRVQEGLGKIK